MRPLYALAFVVGASSLFAADWPRFKGPLGSGISTETSLASRIDIEKDLVWKRAIPPGVSSPIVVSDRVVLTGYDKEGLAIIGLDSATGEQLWRLVRS